MLKGIVKGIIFAVLGYALGLGLVFLIGCVIGIIGHFSGFDPLPVAETAGIFLCWVPYATLGMMVFAGIKNA